MKETGVVRRVDELGRIVIPKEIRKRFQIDSGDFVDIATDSNRIVLEKHHPLNEMSSSLNPLIDALFSEFQSNIIITDKYQIVVSTITEINIGDLLSLEFQKRIKELNEVECSKSLQLKLTNDYTINYDFFSKEIWIDSEYYGQVIILDHMITKRSKEVCNIIINFLKTSI